MDSITKCDYTYPKGSLKYKGQWLVYKGIKGLGPE